MVARFQLTLRAITGLLLAMGVVAGQSFGQDWDESGRRFRVTSSTFANNSSMPLSTISNNVVNGVNACSANGAAGGNESPELSWTGAPEGTRTFVVVAYDVTASFTHWGIYNIPGTSTGLPENAGVQNSSFGSEILNDFGVAEEYDGPCPPAGIAPETHQYVFTVYALSASLELSSSENFPANAETLYHALIAAGRRHEILATASTTGLYSSTPGKN